jgi:hypothetical protein
MGKWTALRRPDARGVNVMFDDDACVMVDLFQDVFPVGFVETDRAKYVAKYDSIIKDAGRLFEYLGLAKPDEKGLLGWKPARLLLQLIAERHLTRQENEGKGDDEFTVDLLIDAVFGDRVEAHRGCLGLLVLLEVGLLQQNRTGGLGATPGLRDLFHNGDHMRFYNMPQHLEASAP